MQMRSFVTRSTAATVMTVWLSLFAATLFAAEIKGFRSARFGDDEAAVRAAMAKDLGVQGDAVRVAVDAILGVKTLSAKLDSFAPLNAPAEVAYAFGSSCRCLIQVAIKWQLPEDRVRKADALGGVAALADKFARDGWEKDHSALNRVLGEPKPGAELTLMLFRGEQGKAAITLLGSPVTVSGGETKAGQGGAGQPGLSVNVDAMTTVVLVYDADVGKPDIGRNDVKNF
jgi:hypothetical protein